jgi:hypothetical protein
MTSSSGPSKCFTEDIEGLKVKPSHETRPFGLLVILLADSSPPSAVVDFHNDLLMPTFKGYWQSEMIFHGDLILKRHKRHCWDKNVSHEITSGFLADACMGTTHHTRCIHKKLCLPFVFDSAASCGARLNWPHGPDGRTCAKCGWCARLLSTPTAGRKWQRGTL